MSKFVIAAVIVIVLAALGYVNYRRFVPKPETLGKKAYEVEIHKLSVPAGGHTLYGELLLPQGLQGKLPTIVCSHGLNGSYHYFRDYVGMCLAMSGYAVCCFDFYGGSVRGKSGGKMTEMSVFTERDDLNAVIDWVMTQETTDAAQLFLFGESQGGFVTAITAAQRPQDIRAVIEYYPALCIPDDARKRFHSAEEIPVEYKHMGRRFGRIYCEDLLDYDVYAEIPAYEGPVLILHGDHDQTVDISYGQKAAAVYKKAEFICLPGEIHGFTGDGRKKAARLTYDFLQRTLGLDDTEEILRIAVTLTGGSMKHEGIYNVMTVPFTGTAESKWFKGVILPGAADVQRRKLWVTERFCADYTLEGVDHTGAKCQIHIVNVDEGQGWKPTVTTDSKALDFLNYGKCRAVLLGHKDKLTVRIYAKPEG